MNKISCDVCIDLMPLVKDEVASNDSKQAVYEHLKTCPNCRLLYGQEVNYQNSDQKIISVIKKNISYLCFIIILLGILFGISISSNQFMFYNILIMPTIGAIAYLVLKKNVIYICVAVFSIVYLRWLYDCIGHALNGQYILALIPPLLWALIYLFLTIIGICIAALLQYASKKLTI